MTKAIPPAERRFGVGLIHDLPVGEHAVCVENIYLLDGGGYVWVMTHKPTGRRIEAAAPLLTVVGTDVRAEASDLQRIRGVRVTLPTALARAVGTDTAMQMPWKKLLFSRECTLEVEEGRGDPDHPLTAFVVTRKAS